MVKTFFKHCLFYVGTVLIGILLYILLVHTPLFGSLTVYLYRALAITAVVGILMTVVVLLVHRKLRFISADFRDVALGMVLLMAFLVLFNSIVMVSLDRSISVFILSDMAQNEEKIFSEEDVTNRFMDIYMEEYQAMNQRFEEQIVSGNIKEVEGGLPAYWAR